MNPLKYLKQRAVYWEKIADDASGNPRYADPIEIKCRWDEISEVFLGDDGTDETSNAIVMVDRDVVRLSFLWLGKLKEVISQTQPHRNPGAYQIRKVEKIPDRNAKKFVRNAIL